MDRISRPHTEDEPSLWAYGGKVMALGAVAPGTLGGLRGLIPLRMMLGNIGVTVVPNQVAISNGFTAFYDAGKLTNAFQAQMLGATISQMISTTNALTASIPASGKDQK